MTVTSIQEVWRDALITRTFPNPAILPLVLLSKNKFYLGIQEVLQKKLMHYLPVNDFIVHTEVYILSY